MIYLIDGHNLIGKMGDIRLADPNDEEKLVRRLHNWAGGDRKRRIELFFDSGDFGGWHTPISAPGIRLYYAKPGQRADDLLIRALRVIKNPQAYTLITSDNEILAAARKRRVGYILSEEFVALMTAELSARAAPPPEPIPADPSTAPQPEIRPEDVAEWLAYFGDVPESGPPPLPAPPPAEETAVPPPTPRQRKEEPVISEAELADWLAVFGDVPETGLENRPPPIPQLAPDPPPAPGKPAPPKRPPAKQKFSTEKLSNDEINEWLTLFGKKK